MQRLLKKTDLMLASSFCMALTFITLLYRFFQPYWETNDDVSMSMRAIPTLYGIYGYSTVTLLVLLSVTTFLLYSLRSLGAGGSRSRLILLVGCLPIYRTLSRVHTTNLLPIVIAYIASAVLH